MWVERKNPQFIILSTVKILVTPDFYIRGVVRNSHRNSYIIVVVIRTARKKVNQVHIFGGPNFTNTER